MENYDVVVIGLGAMGCASLMHVAKMGAKVIGVEANSLTHQYGSSFGETRIFRRAYWEGKKFLPLLQRANELWEALEQEAEIPLITRTGGLFTGQRDTGIIEGCKHTAEQGGIKYEVLDEIEIRKRFPAYRPTSDMVAIYEPGAYAISADRARLAMIDIAVRQGAKVALGDKVSDIQIGATGVSVATSTGNIISAGYVIVTTGPWISANLIQDLQELLVPKQVSVYWFLPRKEHKRDYTLDKFPVFLFDYPGGYLLYGIPQLGWEKGIKIGFHNHQQKTANPDNRERQVRTEDAAEISRVVGEIFPGLDSRPVDSKGCFYTMSADESFYIGRSAQSNRVCFASVCSGHGFKFATSVGEILAALSVDASLKIDISAFSTTRFNQENRGHPLIG